MTKTELELFFGVKLSVRKCRGSLRGFTAFTPSRIKGNIINLDWDKLQSLKAKLNNIFNSYGLDRVLIWANN